MIAERYKFQHRNKLELKTVAQSKVELGRLALNRVFGTCFGRRSVSGAPRLRMGNHSNSEEVNGSEKLGFDFTGLKQHNLRRTTKKVFGKSVIPGQSNEIAVSLFFVVESILQQSVGPSHTKSHLAKMYNKESK